MLFLNKSLSQIFAFALIGLLVAMGFLLLEREGRLTAQSIVLRKKAQLAAGLWLITSALAIILTLRNILGTSLAEALEGDTLRSFLTQVELGRYLGAQLLLVAAITLLLPFLRAVLPTIFISLLAIIALAIPVFQSHSASSGSHTLAIGSLVIHVAALSLWVGGIFAIAFIAQGDRRWVLPRFSQMALWAAIAVVASGVTNAWARLNFADAWSSSYARIVLVKVALTALLIYLGYRNRKSLESAESTGWGFVTRLVAVEALIMGALTFLGSWLSTSEPPTREGPIATTAESLIGIATPGEPTFRRILFTYEPDALIIGVLLLLVALYVKGVVVLTRRGDKWPVGRTVAFAFAISIVDFATSGGLGVYALFSFEYHMIAHMLIGMVAPICLVLSAPITLALRTLPQGRTSEERGVRGSALALLHSRYSAIITHPISALAVFDGSLFLLYFTDLFGNLMQSHVGHLLMTGHFFLAGFLFFHVIIGIDPNPRKVPYLVRIVMLFAAMSIHAFFSIALMSTTTLIDGGYFASLETPWLGDLLDDQRAGGSIGWAMGEIPIILALIATFILWMRDDKRESKRIDRNEARLAAQGEPDELAQYNNYLSKLQQRNERQGR